MGKDGNIEGEENQGAKGGMQLFRTFSVGTADSISGYGGGMLKAVGENVVELHIYSTEESATGGSRRYTIEVNDLIELIRKHAAHV